MPGICHHAGSETAQVDIAAVGHPCHSHQPPPCHVSEDASPCHGTQSNLNDDGCNCGCCHVAVAMLPLGMPNLPTLHDPAATSPAPADLSFITPPAHRPPISLPI